MRREGSPFQGVGTVVVKELADNLSSARMFVLEWLIVLTALAALYSAIDSLRRTTAQDPFLLLRLFTVNHEPLPSFGAILGFLIPLMATGLGVDAINGEHNRRTLSRILAQPIYRDALLIGKFLAGLVMLAMSLAALWLMVIGLGLIFLGVPPGGEEMSRSLAFLVIAVFYAGVWLALAMLLSIVFRSAGLSEDAARDAGAAYAANPAWLVQLGAGDQNRVERVSLRNGEALVISGLSSTNVDVLRSDATRVYSVSSPTRERAIAMAEAIP